MRTTNHDPGIPAALPLDAGPGESNEVAHDRLSMSTRGRSWALSTATPPALVTAAKPSTAAEHLDRDYVRRAQNTGARLDFCPLQGIVFASYFCAFRWPSGISPQERFFNAPTAKFPDPTPIRAIGRTAACAMRNRLAASLAEEVASSSLRAKLRRARVSARSRGFPSSRRAQVSAFALNGGKHSLHRVSECNPLAFRDDLNCGPRRGGKLRERALLRSAIGGQYLLARSDPSKSGGSIFGQLACDVKVVSVSISYDLT